MTKDKYDWVEDRNKKPYFICKGCCETITKPKHYSKEKGYCIHCLEIKKAIENDKCLSCGKGNPKREYWGVCEICWNKSLDDCEKENQKLFEKEAKKLNIPVEEYIKRMENEL